MGSAPKAIGHTLSYPRAHQGVPCVAGKNGRGSIHSQGSNLVAVWWSPKILAGDDLKGDNTSSLYRNRFTDELKLNPWMAKAPRTVTDWSGIGVVPGSVDLATNDPLPPVVVSWVTHEHHDGIILVLGSIYQSPPPVFHSRVANVGTGHRWKGQRSKKSVETSHEVWCHFN